MEPPQEVLTQLVDMIVEGRENRGLTHWSSYVDAKFEFGPEARKEAIDLMVLAFRDRGYVVSVTIDSVCVAPSHLVLSTFVKSLKGNSDG